MRNVDLFDDYLNGTLSAAEKESFELQLAGDKVFENAFNEHKSLVEALQQYNQTSTLKAQLNAIHESEFANDARILHINKKETLLQRYGKTVMVAASTAVIVVLSTIAAVSPGVKQQNNQITELGLIQKATNDAIVEGIKEGSLLKPVHAPANLEGSAFALNNNGYIVTSLHMIKGADSVFIQNSALERTLTKVVITDPKLDLAILKIENAALFKNWQVPFTFSEKSSDIGEKVFTLGYPRKDMVYGEGSLSSLSGYYNDTTMYQISIPVNPGNSGGPLLDEQGNIIGVIRGKITSAEATGFAIKAKEIIKAINTVGGDTIQAVNKKITLKGVKRTEQVKRINPYVFNVLVYKKEEF